MRTVSFSSEAVQELLNDRFVCTRLNTEGDPTAGESFSHRPSDPAGPCLRGNGKQNVQVLFLTPDGEIFHTLTGFVGPEDLEAELKFALATFKSLPTDREKAQRQLVEAHADYLKEQGYTRDEIERSANDPTGMADLFQGFSNLGASAVQGSARGTFDPRQFAGGFDPQQFAGGFNAEKMLDAFTRPQALSDHRFAMDHPLLPLKEFRPEMLVGSGKSFFGSTSSGNIFPQQRGGRR